MGRGERLSEAQRCSHWKCETFGCFGYCEYAKLLQQEVERKGRAALTQAEDKP